MKINTYRNISAGILAEPAEDGEEGSARDGQVACQVPKLYAEETGDVRQEVFLRFGVAVFPVGDCSAHETEDFVAACTGHAFLFPEDPEFGSETHRSTAFLLSG